MSIIESLVFGLVLAFALDAPALVMVLISCAREKIKSRQDAP